MFNHVCFRVFRSKFGISGLIEPTTHVVVVVVHRGIWVTNWIIDKNFLSLQKLKFDVHEITLKKRRLRLNLLIWGPKCKLVHLHERKISLLWIIKSSNKNYDIQNLQAHSSWAQRDWSSPMGDSIHLQCTNSSTNLYLPTAQTTPLILLLLLLNTEV